MGTPIRYVGLGITTMALLLILAAKLAVMPAWVMPLAQVLASVGVVLLIVNIYRQFRASGRR